MKQLRQSEQPPSPPLPPFVEIDTATLRLLESWTREDATSDPAEVRAAEVELAEFKKALNENRASAGETALYP